MQNKKRILALDIGSSSVKAALWNGHKFKAHIRIPYKTIYAGTHVEIPAHKILAAVTQAGKLALHNTTSIDAIAFCVLSSAVVITDEHYKPRIGAITHQDRRSITESQNLVAHFGKKYLLHHTANLPYPGGIGSSTLAWIHRHSPNTLRGKYHAGQLSSLIAHLLTGNWTIDPSQAVFLGLWDIQKNQWNPDLCKATGIHPDSLPTLKFADQLTGHLTPQLAKKWNIHPHVPVLGGFVDTSAALLPTPMLPGQLIHNTGSTDVLALTTEKPNPLEGILTRPVGTGAGPFPHRWLAVRTIAAAGSALAWARSTLFPKITDPQWTKLLQKACHTQTPITCLPTFAGDRTAIEQPPGATFTNLTLASTREEMLTALFAGLITQSTTNYHLLAHLHKPQKTVYAIGTLADLATAMHKSWPAHHTFKTLKGDSLQGLVTLAQKTIK